MALNKKNVSQLLSHLNWREGLTREEMMLGLGKAHDEINHELYYHLPPNKRFRSAREVIDSLPASVWTGIGDALHEELPVSGPSVAPESAARGKTSLGAQKERTREQHLDGDKD